MTALELIKQICEIFEANPIRETLLATVSMVEEETGQLVPIEGVILEHGVIKLVSGYTKSESEI